VHEDDQEKRAPCPECGVAIDVPRLSDKPCYQTDRLEVYQKKYQKIAKRIFDQLKGKIGDRANDKPKGSYSVIATTSKERVGKILIYESEKGHDRGDRFPILKDGVFIFIRSNDASAAKIWTKKMVEVQFPDLFALISPEKTLGVTPPCRERFAYFRVDTEQDEEQLTNLISRIVALLDECSRA